MSDHEQPDAAGPEPDPDPPTGDPAPPAFDEDGVPSAFEGKGLTEPLDQTDPRFTGFARPPAGPRQRELVESRGPGQSPMDRRVRIIRMAIPTIAIAGVVAVAAVFWNALTPDSGEVALGDADAVIEAVAERPLRVCRGEGPPCAWLTTVDGELVALNTSGPVHAEYGRQGVGWCPSSGYFGANSTDSRYDPAGRLVAGPATRGLDRFRLSEEDDGELVIDFSRRTAGPRAGEASPLPRTGPACDEIPFDREPRLEVPEDG